MNRPSHKQKYNVTVLVDAHSKEEAREIVAGQSNPHDYTQSFWGRDAYAMGVQRAQFGDPLPYDFAYLANKHFKSPGMITFWNNSTDKERKAAVKEFRAAYTAGYRKGGAGKSNPEKLLTFDDAIRVERYDSPARVWRRIKLYPGDKWETTPSDLPAIAKFASREAKIERQMVRVIRGNQMFAGFYSDGKPVPRNQWGSM